MRFEAVSKRLNEEIKFPYVYFSELEGKNSYLKKNTSKSVDILF